MLGYNMNIIERGIRGIFAREFITRARKVKYSRFCTVVDSDKREEKYNAISTLPQLSEMTDERAMSGFSEYSETITNKVYATGIKIPRTLFEFDQTGQLRTLTQSLGSRVANFPDKLVFTLMGANSACYDTVAMYATTHDLGDGVSQINLLTGTTTNTMLAGWATADARMAAIASFQSDLMRAKAALMEICDDRGEPWHDDAEPEGLIIVCHPKMEFLVRTALEAAVLDATGNVTAHSIGSIITTNYKMPFLESGVMRYGTWYLLKVDTPIQPYIFQRFGPKTNFPDSIPEADQAPLQALNSVEVQTIMRTGSDIADITFFNDEFLVGARVIYAAGNGMWQDAIKVLGSAS
jgi:phage major head subunit gpT-like protein